MVDQIEKSKAVKGIELSDELALPLDYVTQRGALLAVSGAGKSNAARVIAEGFFEKGLPFVVIDPKGDWWGLRAGRDGKPGGGLGAVIFGGDHADIPLEERAGVLVADTIVDQRLSSILDLSHFESDAAMHRFLLDFGTRLYQRNRDPLHLFCEECDEYLPQKPFKDMLKLLHMFERIVRRGRTKGLGITLITQRSAVVNKNVLTQVETLFALRTTGPQDIAAVEAWMKYHGADRAMLSSLASLENGEAWVWSPHYLRKMERFRFYRSKTFDSGATPTNHSKKSTRAAATLADVDLAALKTRMAETLERAEAEDPKALRKRVAELEKEKAKGNWAGSAVELDAARGRIRELEAWGKDMEGELARLKHELGRMAAYFTQLGGELDTLSKAKGSMETFSQSVHVPEVKGRVPPLSAGLKARLEVGKLGTPIPKRINQAMRITAVTREALGLPKNGNVDAGRVMGSQKLGKCAKALLAALVQHGDMSLQQAAIVAGYPSTAPIVIKSAGELRSAGLIAGTNGLLVVTAEGGKHPALRDVEPLPTGRKLADYWLGRLGKCEEAILREVLEAHPKPVSLDSAAWNAGYESGAPIVIKSAGRLRTLMLVNGSNAALTANKRLV